MTESQLEAIAGVLNAQLFEGTKSWQVSRAGPCDLIVRDDQGLGRNPRKLTVDDVPWIAKQLDPGLGDRLQALSSSSAWSGCPELEGIQTKVNQGESARRKVATQFASLLEIPLLSPIDSARGVL